MLYSPREHEPLVEDPWHEQTVRRAVATIAADAEAAFHAGWPAHPLDEQEPTRFRGLYLGGAGVVDALRRLAARGFHEPRRDYVPYLEALLEQPPEAEFADSDGSLWVGEAGIRLVLERLAPSPANRARVAELVAGNAHDERRELMWGSPGTILIGAEVGLDIEASRAWLRAQRDEDGLWRQELYGSSTRYLGPAHGYAGAALALGDGDGVAEVMRRYAVREGGLANWPPLAGGGLKPAESQPIRVQFCHGAPGIVTTLVPWLDGDLAAAGGELTWVAGPLRKGAGLCHGTAGNGYAFLALLAHTGETLWLERSRAFAMHALRQVEVARAQHGRGRHTLWTGDLGAALYLADCVDGRFDLPVP